jgi:hypothetical protein
MKYLSLICLVVVLAGCSKETNGDQVEIYLLKSFTRSVDTSYYPAVTVINNPVIDSLPLISNNEIRWYKESDARFQLTANINDRVKNLGPDKSFAVTVNRQIIYCGNIHPTYMSSVRYGIATIDPILTANELEMHYLLFAASASIQQLDKRNDPRLLQALRTTGRLR